MKSRSSKNPNFPHLQISKASNQESFELYGSISPELKNNNGSYSVRKIKDDPFFEMFSKPKITPNSDRKQPRTPITRTNERLQTLKILQGGSQNRWELDSPSTKRNMFQGQIKAGDSANTIKAIINQGMKDHHLKKSKKAKGIMYINDLWGINYQSEVVKSTGIEEEEIQERKRHSQLHLSQLEKGFIQQQPHSARLPKNSAFPDLSTPSTPFTKRVLDTANSKSPRDKAKPQDLKLASSSSLKTFYLGNKDEPSAISTPSIKTHRTTTTGFSKISNQSLSNSKKLTPHSLTIGRDSDSHLAKPDGQASSEISNYGLSLYSTSTSKFFKRFSLKTKGRDEESSLKRHQNFFTLQSIHGFDDNDRLPLSASRDLESSRTKLFIDEKNIEMKKLVRNCEGELRKKNECLKLVNDLEGLFVNHKFDKSKKLQLLKKIGCINECRSALEKRRNYISNAAATSNASNAKLS